MKRDEILCEGCLPTLNGAEQGTKCCVCGWDAPIKEQKVTAGLEECRKIVSDTELVHAFRGTNFGVNTIDSFRKLLAHGILSRAAGFHTGWTLTQVMRELKLTTPRDVPTIKGKRYVMWHFYDQKHEG